MISILGVMEDAQPFGHRQEHQTKEDHHSGKVTKRVLSISML